MSKFAFIILSASLGLATTSAPAQGAEGVSGAMTTTTTTTSTAVVPSVTLPGVGTLSVTAAGLGVAGGLGVISAVVAASGGDSSTTTTTTTTSTTSTN
jgi:hypothetical protein